MRKLVTAAAAALALTIGAAPAFADQNQSGSYPYQGGYKQNYAPNGQYDDDYRYPRDGRFDRRYYDRYDFNRHNGNFDKWERGWNGRGFDQQYRYQKPMSLRKIVRALAYQGFYGVRNLERSRHGWGYRAFAFDRSGRAVMLRVNAYNGRVMEARYI